MATSEALRGIYQDLKDLTAEGSLLYDKIEYVKKNGKLPSAPKGDTELYAMDYAQVKDKIRRLNDLISKTKTKLKPSAKPHRQSKINEWQIKLANAEMERETLIRRKREIENVR